LVVGPFRGKNPPEFELNGTSPFSAFQGNVWMYTSSSHNKTRDVLYVTVGQSGFLNLQAVIFEDCPSVEDSD
jgi:hypothetical protein